MHGLTTRYRSEVGIGQLHLVPAGARAAGSVIVDLSGDEHPLYIEEFDRGAYFKFMLVAASESGALGEARAIVLIALRSIGVNDQEISAATVEVIHQT